MLPFLLDSIITRIKNHRFRIHHVRNLELPRESVKDCSERSGRIIKKMFGLLFLFGLSSSNVHFFSQTAGARMKFSDGNPRVNDM